MLERAAQGGDGVAIPGGVQNMFRTWFSRHGGVGLMVGLDDLRGLFQPYWCMEVLAPTSSGVTSPFPVWGSAVTFRVHDMIGDAGWQMVCVCFGVCCSLRTGEEQKASTHWRVCSIGDGHARWDFLPLNFFVRLQTDLPSDLDVV